MEDETLSTKISEYYEEDRYSTDLERYYEVQSEKADEAWENDL